MSVLFIIIDALLPIALVILLGIVAGRTGMIKPEQSSVLADLALDFCLPSLLFVATATMSTAELSKWQFFLDISLGLLAVYVVAFLVTLLVFRKPVADSSLQALNSAFPNMAFMGIPVLSAVMGAGAVLSVVVGNLLSSFVLIPLTLTLLEAGSAGQTDRKASVVVWESVLSAVKKPLVWAPLPGVLMAFLHIRLPGVAQKFFTLIGQATSGVALFAMGLLLAGQTFHVSVPSLANVPSRTSFSRP